VVRKEFADDKRSARENETCLMLCCRKLATLFANDQISSHRPITSPKQCNAPFLRTNQVQDI